MNKEIIARDINYTAPNAARTIIVRNNEYTAGQVFTTQKAESWESGSSQSFKCENDWGKELTFICADLPCHKVDYDNDEEVEILNAHEHEAEVLVPAGTTFKVTSVSTDGDYEEMGYYEVVLEFISNEN